MMDCKSMTTPITTNLKLFGDTSSGTIDATPLEADDRFVDVLDEHPTGHMFCGEHIESVYG